jgi:hypothetical protein
VKANPKYLKAHALVGYAVRIGRIHPKPCEICGLKAEAHHEDYKKPYEVRWLCRFHHIDQHKSDRCTKGHLYSEANTYWNKNGWRQCRACHREYAREHAVLKGTPSNPELNRRKTHCPNGHPYSGENLYMDSRGWRQCKACRPNWGRR